MIVSIEFLSLSRKQLCQLEERMSAGSPPFTHIILSLFNLRQPKKPATIAFTLHLRFFQKINESPFQYKFTITNAPCDFVKTAWKACDIVF